MKEYTITQIHYDVNTPLSCTVRKVRAKNIEDATYKFRTAIKGFVQHKLPTQ